MGLYKVKEEYNWKIDDFTNLKETAQSKEIIVWRGERETKWRLLLHPFSGGIKDTGKNISVFLQLISPFPETCKSSFSIVKKDGFKTRELRFSKTFTEKGKDWGYADYISREKLIKDKYSFLPNGILTISFSISPVQHEEYQDLSTQEVVPPLIVANEKLFLDESGDIKLIVGEVENAKEFNVHKAIISVRSPVFDVMLSSDMKEGVTKVVHITDISSDIVEEFLYYLYTNSVRNLEKNDKDLIVVADKYDVVDLKNICGKSLCKKVTVATVTKLLQLSNRNDCQILKETCIKFIVKNPTAVIKNKGWKKFKKNGENITAVAEVMERLIKQNYTDGNEDENDEDDDDSE